MSRSLETMRARIKHVWQQAGWDEFVLLLAVVTFSLCVWGFIELADDAPAGDYLEIEEKIMWWFRQPESPAITKGPWWLKEVGRDLTALGGATVLVLNTGLVVGFLLLRGRRRTALFVTIATAGGYLLSYFLKELFGRDRPQVVPHLQEVTSASFPSGHSMSASVVYLTLGALLARTAAQRREKIYVIGAALLLSGLIGVSRIFLGVHYPTDVLAGWAGGTAWALLCWCIAYWLQQRGTLRAAPSEESASSTT